MVEPVIVELAVNGATPRHRNRHVPRTPAEIAEVALAGIELGRVDRAQPQRRADVHPDGVHAVEPYLAAWRPVLERYPERCCTRRWPRERGESRCSGGGRTWRSWPAGAWAA